MRLTAISSVGRRSFGAWWVAVAAAMWAGSAAHASIPLSSSADRTTFPHSIAAVAPAATDASGRPNHAFVSRPTLTPDETAAVMPFEVALKMRNFDELEARLAHSEIISPAEMQARYWPLAEEHDRVVRWLAAEGLTVTRTDSNHLAVFARGTVAEVARVLQTNFARVTSGGVETTSAITAPNVPAPLAASIRGIHGLQPHQRLRHRPQSTLLPLAGTGSSLPYYPAQIAKAYNASGLTQTGAGQTIAVYALAFPRTTDLTTFWSTTGTAASLANIQNVNVAGGPATNTSSGSLQEATLDVEWASALAPGAVIRIYAANETDPVGDDELIQQVLADLPTQPTLHQLTISFGADETTSDRDYIAIEAQYMASLVSAGVTVFAASGDSGPFGNNGSVQTGYPASMPDVTAVGGTTLTLNTDGTIANETAWGSAASSGSNGASGGGVSLIFNRPAWQTGAGVPAGTMRLVPDVAAVGDPNTGAMIIYNGNTRQIGGTSLSSPIWAAWCALLNQARASAGKPPLGALNPRIYPLAGTAAFRDITGGGNTTFQAGPGYDLCTGIGAPNIAALMQATMADTFAPVIEVQSGDRFTTVGQSATFYVIATAIPTPSYLWQRLAAGTSSWTDLADNAGYAGTGNYALSVMGASQTMNGDQFRCVVTNSLSSVTTAPATLTVATGGVSTLAGWPGWSGFADGRGSAGRFNYTGSVRVDPAGNVYVADASNHTVRKITPAGVVSTLAGAPGVAGSTDGPGTVARFNGPAGVAIDAAGNVLVADSQNYTIRRITPDGTVSTFAGTAGTRGRADGTGSAASFYDPENLAVDSAGNLYVADGAGNIVRKITPAGVVTTIAGAAASGTVDGTGSAARFNLLAGIAVDSAGNVYVGDYNNHAVRKITPAGVVTTLAGLPGRLNNGFLDGTGTGARLNGPTGLAVDAGGTVYFADSLNNAIRQISPAGVVTTLGGSPTVAENIDGPLNVARFNSPADVALDASGNLYVADAYNCTVRRIVLARATPPVITAAPRSQAVGLGGVLALSVVATGDGPFAYQWFDNGSPVAGATAANYTVPAATAATAGSYSVVVTGSGGITTSTAAVVTTAPAVPARLTNLSARAVAGGAQTLTLGFVLRGSGNKTVLVRGVGPGLATFGVTGVLADPKLTLFGPNSSTLVVGSNSGWNNSDATAIAATGAFPLVRSSLDSALITSLAAASYTAQVTGTTPGQALAEVYDGSIGVGASLVNLSTSAPLDASGSLIAGFTISGNVGKTILVRAIGPTLGLPSANGQGGFDVPNAMADPTLELYNDASVKIAANDNWGGDVQLTTAMAQVGAFPLPQAGSKDSVLLVTLPPGGYTAIARGANGSTGLVLIELYDVQ